MSVRGVFTARSIRIACLMATGAIASFGSILYNNPFLSGADIFSADPSSLLADPFTIASGGTVTEASWYGELYNGDPGTTLETQFYASASGLPGTVLDSVTRVVSVVDQLKTDAYGKELYQFNLTLPVAFTADAGVQYFFSVSDPNTPSDFLWANGTSLVVGDVAPIPGLGGTWTAINESQSFTLSGDIAPSAPEPATFLLTGLSLFGAILIKRQRKLKAISRIS